MTTHLTGHYIFPKMIKKPGKIKMSDFQKNSQKKNYRIKVKEKLDANWSDWLNGMEMTVKTGKGDEPVTVLTGPVADQAALNGLLNKIWGLNLTVLSVEQIEED
jgi:hypothetical protein